MKLNTAEKIAAALAVVFIIAALAVSLAGRGGGVSVKTQAPASTQEIMSGSDGDEAEALTPGETVDINTADSAALQKLPGIGEVLADRIIQYRKANGGFSAIEDIMNVEGIGQAKFDAMKGSITV